MFKKGFFILALLFVAIFASLFFAIPKTEATNTILDYDYEIISQSSYPNTLNAEEVTQVSIQIKNTGSNTWKNNGENIVRLGSGSKYGTLIQQRDYDSEFYAPDWLSQNRPVNINKEEIKPGEIANFVFNIKAPKENGAYKAYFTPVVDGYKWMKDSGIYWQITVKNGQDTKINSSLDENYLYKNIAPSVVKIVCRFNENIMSQGSGTLLKNTSNSAGLPPIYILTNLHVIETENGSTPLCEIRLYPKPDLQEYLTFQSIGYRGFGEKIDFAILEPTVGYNNTGTIEDLYKYAKPNSELIKINPKEERENKDIYVFGYPSNGGLSLTKGRFLDYEVYENSLYIDTDALLRRGNSGGLAIDETGEMIGIPTSIRGSIGMILDIDYLLNSLKI